MLHDAQFISILKFDLKDLQSLCIVVVFGVSLVLRFWWQSVSCFTGTNLRWNPKSLKPLILRGRPGVARASSPDTIIEDICQVGDHFLDSASNFVLKQIQKPMAKYLPADHDPLHFLPVNIHSKFHKSEALVRIPPRSRFRLVL